MSAAAARATRGRPRFYPFQDLVKPGDRFAIPIGDRLPQTAAGCIQICAHNYAAKHEPGFIVQVRRKGAWLIVERLPATGESRPILNARAVIARFEQECGAIDLTAYRAYRRAKFILERLT